LNLAVEWLTFRAVFSRHWKEFVSHKASILATVFWPLPLLALNIYQYLGLADENAISQVLSERYGIASFSGMVILGTIVYLLYNRMLWGTGDSLQEERWRGTLENLLLTPATRTTILLATGCGSVVEGSWWIAGVFLLSWLIFGVKLVVVDWLAVIVTLTSVMVGLIAVGVFFASFFLLTRAADQFAASLQAPIRYLSGVAFPVAALPAIAQLFAYILPVTYGIEALRGALIQGNALDNLLGALLPLYLFTASLTILGHYIIRIVEARAKRTGDLYKI